MKNLVKVSAVLLSVFLAVAVNAQDGVDNAKKKKLSDPTKQAIAGGAFVAGAGVIASDDDSSSTTGSTGTK